MCLPQNVLPGQEQPRYNFQLISSEVTSLLQHHQYQHHYQHQNNKSTRNDSFLESLKDLLVSPNNKLNQKKKKKTENGSQNQKNKFDDCHLSYVQITIIVSSCYLKESLNIFMWVETNFVICYHLNLTVSTIKFLLFDHESKTSYYKFNIEAAI